MITHSFSQALEGTTKRLAIWFKLGKKATDVREEAAIQNAAENNQNNVNINADIEGGQQNYPYSAQNPYTSNVDNVKANEENLD